MEGGGRYNADSSAQAVAGTFGVRQLVVAAQSVPATDPAVVVDYGSSEGRNSMGPMSAAVGALRAERADRQVIVFHTDLPSNDFSSLLETVASHPDSYRGPGVYTSMIGRSFYDQLLPTASVTLGWTSITLHWLGRTPCPLRGIWYAQATPGQREVWRRAAAGDWSRFLAARRAELVPGGRLVIVVGAADAAGLSGAEAAIALLDDALAEMVTAGAVSKADREAMAIPAWYRTEDEWRQPFVDTDLALVDLELRDLGDPLWDQAIAAAPTLPPGHATVRTDYARAVSAALRVSFGPSLLAPVDQARRAQVEAELFDRCTDAVIRAGGPLFRWHLAIITIAAPS